jgi:hypothetical protein
MTSLLCSCRGLLGDLTTASRALEEVVERSVRLLALIANVYVGGVTTEVARFDDIESMRRELAQGSTAGRGRPSLVRWMSELHREESSSYRSRLGLAGADLGCGRRKPLPSAAELELISQASRLLGRDWRRGRPRPRGFGAGLQERGSRAKRGRGRPEPAGRPNRKTSSKNESGWSRPDRKTSLTSEGRSRPRLVRSRDQPPAVDAPIWRGSGSGAVDDGAAVVGAR